MTDKQKDILDILTRQDDRFISGQILAQTFSCSRAAVWKNIKSLRDKGYPIEAVTHKGYRLMSTRVAMEKEIHTRLLQADLHSMFNVHVVDTIDSTNTNVRAEGVSGKDQGYVCVARTQNQGRGRQGKEWISDRADGLWFSLLLRPHILPENTGLLSLFFAWNVCIAIQDCGLSDVAIKWPNDIISLRSGKKICGILSEASFEDEKLSFAVVGCGVNVSQQRFPQSIEDIATSLKMEGLDVSVPVLLVAILKRFDVAYAKFSDNPSGFISSYKKECVTLGRDVRVISNEQIVGKAVDISDKGALIIDLGNGIMRAFFAGEVSVRGLMGYV